MKKYLYTFTRQDIRPEQQLVQTAHVAMKLGFNLNEKEDPDNTYFVCVGVRNADALIAVEQILAEFGFRYETFCEPDINDGEITSIAVYPINEDKKGVLQAFNLLKF